MTKTKMLVINEIRKLKSKLFRKQIEVSNIEKDIKELEEEAKNME